MHHEEIKFCRVKEKNLKTLLECLKRELIASLYGIIKTIFGECSDLCHICIYSSSCIHLARVLLKNVIRLQTREHVSTASRCRKKVHFSYTDNYTEIHKQVEHKFSSIRKNMTRCKIYGWFSTLINNSQAMWKCGGKNKIFLLSQMEKELTRHTKKRQKKICVNINNVGR